MRKGWIDTTLGELAQINPESLGMRTPNDYEFGYIDLSMVNRGQVSYPLEKIKYKDASPRARRIVRNGDIILSTVRPNLKGFGRILRQDSDLICSTGFAVLRCSKEETADYLYQYIFSDFIERQIDALVVGSNYPAINNDDVQNLQISIPNSQAEQKKIAAILRTWDDAIEKLEKLALAKQRRLNHLSVLLFQYSEKHGKRKIFSDFLTESSVTGATGESAKKITVKLYGKGVFAKKERNVGSASTRYYVRSAGQLIYSKLDFLNGAFGIIPKELDGYESTQDLPAFDISPSINSKWLLAYLTRETFYTSCVNIARGQRKARRINPSDFLEVPLKVPSRDIQDSIAEILNYAQHDLEQTNHQKSLIQSQKRGLMQKLLTGAWPVQTSDKEAA